MVTSRRVLLVVCPNLCLDRVVVVPDFHTGRVHRAASAAALASGKGLNVARAARALGADVIVIGATGTDSAAGAILRGARDHGIRLRAVRVEGSARVCTLIVDPGRDETVINEPGPVVDAAAARLLMTRAHTAMHRADAVVLAGSLPPGLPADFYAGVIATAREVKRIPVLLDAAGAPLHRGLAAHPDIVKVNRMELAGAAGRALSSQDDVLTAAGALVTDFGCTVVVTMGAEGAALVTARDRWLFAAPPVQRVNTIGAGDSLTAGLMVSLLRGLALPDAVRVAVAAAAADVGTLLPGTLDAAQVDQLRPLVAMQAAAR